MRSFAGNDRLKGRAGDDWLGGMSGSDAVHGNAGDDELRGGGGRDILRGGTGDDRLDGGKGRNLLTGGEGDDTFVFRMAGKPNRITDFGKGDLIALGFPGLGPAGPLDPSAFHRGRDGQQARPDDPLRRGYRLAALCPERARHRRSRSPSPGSASTSTTSARRILS